MTSPNNGCKEDYLLLSFKEFCSFVNKRANVLCGSKKYPYFPTDGSLVWTLPPPGTSSLASYFPLKVWAIEISLPYGISNYDHPWGGYEYFLEPHIYAQIVPADY